MMMVLLVLGHESVKAIRGCYPNKKEGGGGGH